MKNYGQFCPLAQAAQILCERWTLIIVRELIAGSSRFRDLQKGAPQISPTLLSTRLKQLESAGVVNRTGDHHAGEYSLTQAGIELKPIVELLGAWGHRWARTRLKDEDLDAGLLMWDMRRSVNPGAFPGHRVVVQFEYPDAPVGAQHWWLVSEEREIDLCLDDPGFDVDLLVRCPLKIITAVWTCQLAFNDAVSNGDIRVMGDSQLKTQLQDWLCSSPLSRLGTLEKFPSINWD